MMLKFASILFPSGHLSFHLNPKRPRSFLTPNPVERKRVAPDLCQVARFLLCRFDAVSGSKSVRSEPGLTTQM